MDVQGRSTPGLGGPNDTDRVAEELRIAGYRAMQPWEKLELVRQMTLAVQTLALARVRRQHPEASEREQKLRLASLWLDPQTMVRVFGWDPREEGY
jgi:hypothetical protein